MLKKIINYLKRPGGAIIITSFLLTAVFAALAITLAVVATGNGGALEILSYPTYALAAISLGYSVYIVVIYGGDMKNKARELVLSVPLGRRMVEQYGFRTAVTAFLSFLANFAYAAFDAVLGIVTRSVWYGALAGYYILLTVTRGVLVYYHKNRANTEDILEQKKLDMQKFKFTGTMLTALPVFLLGAVAQMYLHGAAFIHYSWTVYAFAAFAFYKITMAIINIFRARRSEDVTILAIRNVGLSDALVTILALQSSLLHTFGTGDNGVANLLSGVAVCAITIFLGVSMLLRAAIYNKNKDNGNE